MKIKKGIVLLIFILIVIFAKTSYSKQETSYITKYVSSGETLWSIAKYEVENNVYYKNKDIRYVINDIKYINNLENSNLSAGMEIKIPSY